MDLAIIFGKEIRLGVRYDPMSNNDRLIVKIKSKRNLTIRLDNLTLEDVKDIIKKYSTVADIPKSELEKTHGYLKDFYLVNNGVVEYMEADGLIYKIPEEIDEIKKELTEKTNKKDKGDKMVRITINNGDNRVVTIPNASCEPNDEIELILIDKDGKIRAREKGALKLIQILIEENCDGIEKYKVSIELLKLFKNGCDFYVTEDSEIIYMDGGEYVFKINAKCMKTVLEHLREINRINKGSDGQAFHLRSAQQTLNSIPSFIQETTNVDSRFYQNTLTTPDADTFDMYIGGVRLILRKHINHNSLFIAYAIDTVDNTTLNPDEVYRSLSKCLEKMRENKNKEKKVLARLKNTIKDFLLFPHNGKYIGTYKDMNKEFSWVIVKERDKLIIEGDRNEDKLILKTSSPSIGVLKITPEIEDEIENTIIEAIKESEE